MDLIEEKDRIQLMVEHLAVIPEHTRLPYARKVIWRHTKENTQSHIAEGGDVKCQIYECECWIRKKVSWIIEHADWEWDFVS